MARTAEEVSQGLLAGEEGLDESKPEVRSVQFIDDKQRKVQFQLSRRGTVNLLVGDRQKVENIKNIYAKDRTIFLDGKPIMGGEKEMTVPQGQEEVFIEVIELFGQRRPAAPLPPNGHSRPAANPFITVFGGGPWSMCIRIESGTGLRKADFFSESDAYCIYGLDSEVDKHTAGGKGAKIFRTDHIWNQVNPKWKHVTEIPSFEAGRSLKFAVMDKDWLPFKSDDSLGNCTLKVDSTILTEGVFEDDLKLEGPKAANNSSIRIRLSLGTAADRKKLQALTRLQKVRQGEDLAAIGEAIRKAEEAEVTQRDLAEAKAELSARTRIQEATTIETLLEAVRYAEEVQLEQTRMSQAVARLRSQVVKCLAAAVKSAKVSELEVALRHAEAIDLAQSESYTAALALVEARDREEAERKREAVRHKLEELMLNKLDSLVELLDGGEDDLRKLWELLLGGEPVQRHRVLDKIAKAAAGAEKFQQAEESAMHMQVPDQTAGADEKSQERLSSASGQDSSANRTFVQAVEDMWDKKEGTILRELCDNLRTPAWIQNGSLRGDSPNEATVFARCTQISKQVEKHDLQSEILEGSNPLAILCMYLYTQQDVDTDRFLSFKEVPHFPQEESDRTPEGREEYYAAYRNNPGVRNPKFFDEASRAVRVSHESPDDWRAKAALDKFVKWACVLCALRRRLKEPIETWRGFTKWPQSLVDSFTSLREGDPIFWPALTSTSTDKSIAMNYTTQKPGQGMANILFQIQGISEGIRLDILSQYPAEKEFLLPMFSELEVVEVVKESPPKMICRFKKSWMSEEFDQKCKKDLDQAWTELLKIVADVGKDARKSDQKSERVAALQLAIDEGEEVGLDENELQPAKAELLELTTVTPETDEEARRRKEDERRSLEVAHQRVQQVCTSDDTSAKEVRAAIRDLETAGIGSHTPMVKRAAKLLEQCESLERVFAVSSYTEEEKARETQREVIQYFSERISTAQMEEAIQVAEAVAKEHKFLCLSPLLDRATKALKAAKQRDAMETVAEVCQRFSKAIEVEDASAENLEFITQAHEALQECVTIARTLECLDTDLLLEAERVRKALHNRIQDLKGQIRVICRARPMSKMEKSQGDKRVIRQFDFVSIEVAEETHQSVMSIAMGQKTGPQVETRKFTFNGIFAPGTQEEVFKDCADLVRSALDGYNVTLFAYGQTGAGKTYTLFGDRGCPGIAQRTIDEIFDQIEKSGEFYDFSVSASIVEIYCNDLMDVLRKGEEAEAGSKKPGQFHDIKIKNDQTTGEVRLDGLTSEKCENAATLKHILDRGEKQRATAATAMNIESSRSHLVLTVRIRITDKKTGQEKTSKVVLCDLAGSERLKKSHSTGHRAKEAMEINKSLSALGDVIQALNEGSDFVPYRNHKLTHILQDSLGGTAKTLMFVNCSPASSNIDETLLSLRWAQRVNNVKRQRGNTMTNKTPKPGGTGRRKTKSGKDDMASKTTDRD